MSPTGSPPTTRLSNFLRSRITLANRIFLLTSRPETLPDRRRLADSLMRRAGLPSAGQGAHWHGCAAAWTSGAGGTGISSHLSSHRLMVWPWPAPHLRPCLALVSTPSWFALNAPWRFFRYKCRLRGVHLRFDLLQTLARLPQLGLQIANLPLLLLHRFDQQGGKAGVIDAASIFAVGFVGDQLGHDCAHFLGNHSDLVLARVLQVVGNAAQLLDFRQRVRESFDVGFPAARTVGLPAIGDGMAGALSDGENVGRSGGANARLRMIRGAGVFPGV